MMKIFSWVHRRFNLKDGLGGNVKKDDELIIGKKERTVDRKGLLESNNNVGLVDLIAAADHHWGEGLLTIGTLGCFDHQLRMQTLFQHDYNYCVIGHYSDDGSSEDDDDDYYCDRRNVVVLQQEDEESKPLVLATFKQSSETNTNTDYLKGRPDEDCGNTTLEPATEESSNKDQSEVKKRRVTLAELFSAESNCDDDSGENPMKTAATNSAHQQVKHGFSFAKKLIPRGGDRNKIQQLVRKMLKRKIHPDPSEGKKEQKSRQSKTASMFGHLWDKHSSINDNNGSLSLLGTTASDVEI